MLNARFNVAQRYTAHDAPRDNILNCYGVSIFMIFFTRGCPISRYPQEEVRTQWFIFDGSAQVVFVYPSNSCIQVCLNHPVLAPAIELFDRYWLVWLGLRFFHALQSDQFCYHWLNLVPVVPRLLEASWRSMIVINLSSFRFRRGRRWGRHFSLFAIIANTDISSILWRVWAAVSFNHFDFELTKTSGMEQLVWPKFSIRNFKLYNGWTNMSTSLEAEIKKQNSKKGLEILKLQWGESFRIFGVHCLSV